MGFQQKTGVAAIRTAIRAADEDIAAKRQIVEALDAEETALMAEVRRHIDARRNPALVEVKKAERFRAGLVHALDLLVAADPAAETESDVDPESPGSQLEGAPIGDPPGNQPQNAARPTTKKMGSLAILRDRFPAGATTQELLSACQHRGIAIDRPSLSSYLSQLSKATPPLVRKQGGTWIPIVSGAINGSGAGKPSPDAVDTSDAADLAGVRGFRGRVLSEICRISPKPASTEHLHAVFRAQDPSITRRKITSTVYKLRDRALVVVVKGGVVPRSRDEGDLGERP